MPSCEFCNAIFETQQGVRSHIKQKQECRLAFARSLTSDTSSTNLASSSTSAAVPTVQHDPPEEPNELLFPYRTHQIPHDHPSDMQDDTPSKRRRVTVEEVPDEEAGLPRKPWVEDFPQPAGTPLREGQTYFKGLRERRMGEDESPYAPFADKEEWELAQWLATSGISQQALDKFLKLDIVRHPTHCNPPTGWKLMPILDSQSHQTFLHKQLPVQ